MVGVFAPIVGHLELVQAEPWASVFRAPLPDGETVWFKSCAAHSDFEVPVTASLFAHSPVTVTEVLAHDLDHRWLLMADAGEHIAELGDPPERWLDLLPDYARLQIGELDHAGDHLDVGVPDMRLAQLPERYEELAGPSSAPARGVLAIGAFAERFTSLCAELESHGIGATVQHDDLHMNNVYVRDGAPGARLGRRVDLTPLLLVVRDLPIPDREEPAQPRRPMVRAAAGRIPRTLGAGTRRDLRSRSASRGVRARDHVARPARRAWRRIERSSTRGSTMMLRLALRAPVPTDQAGRSALRTTRRTGRPGARGAGRGR